MVALGSPDRAAGCHHRADAGGRGAGRFKDKPEGKGGVLVSKSVGEVKENAEEMLGHILIITHLANAI